MKGSASGLQAFKNAYDHLRKCQMMMMMIARATTAARATERHQLQLNLNSNSLGFIQHGDSSLTISELKPLIFLSHVTLLCLCILHECVMWIPGNYQCKC